MKKKIYSIAAILAAIAVAIPLFSRPYKPEELENFLYILIFPLGVLAALEGLYSIKEAMSVKSNFKWGIVLYGIIRCLFLLLIALSIFQGAMERVYQV